MEWEINGDLPDADISPPEYLSLPTRGYPDGIEAIVDFERRED